MQPDRWSRARHAWQQGNYPLTKWIIVINVATLLAATFRAPVVEWLGFLAPVSAWRPWTLVTYPLVSTDPIDLLFYGLCLYWFGGSLERSWGTHFYAVYFALMSIISAVGMSIVTLLLGTNFPVHHSLPLAALTVTWCLLNPNFEVWLGIIPITARWLALGTVLIIFCVHVNVHPLLGFFALTGCAASYWWVRWGMRSRRWSNVSLYSMPTAKRASTSPIRKRH